MKIPLTLEAVKASYLEELKIIMAILRSEEGQSKTKKDLNGPESVEWYIDFGVRIGPDSTAQRARLGLKGWADQHIGASLVGKVNRYWHRSVRFEETPEEILESYRQSDRDRAAEQARVDALSPQERQAELNAILGELRGQPGFIELRIPVGGEDV